MAKNCLAIQTIANVIHQQIFLWLQAPPILYVFVQLDNFLHTAQPNKGAQMYYQKISEYGIELKGHFLASIPAIQQTVSNNNMKYHQNLLTIELHHIFTGMTKQA